MLSVIDRAQALYKTRVGLGWSAADVAHKLDVGPRTIGLWETGAQSMPDGRWRLFVHEVKAELERNRSMVVVFASDGLTPIDVVSDANFFDISINDRDGTGVISSYAIDRLSQTPRIHAQSFKLAVNKHVMKAALAWKDALQVGASTGERALLSMHRWLNRRVLEAEAVNPTLRSLKERITAAHQEVEALPKNASASLRSEKMLALDRAVFALIHEVEHSKQIDYQLGA